MNIRQKRLLRTERLRTESEIKEIRSMLGDAYRSFNSISDPNLLEACIYEINALQAKYDYALKKAKAQ